MAAPWNFCQFVKGQSPTQRCCTGSIRRCIVFGSLAAEKTGIGLFTSRQSAAIVINGQSHKVFLLHWHSSSQVQERHKPRQEELLSTSM